ncbi:hypothetical protein M3Y97_00700000 [Aphelenchoides bicaudatus]|nr:hypothetical protein M3Y97_00700000 [Aphelenchoides bicaudatus]
MSDGDQLIFKFNDGSTMPINADLYKICDKVAENKQSGEPVELADDYIAEKFNEFASKFFPKHAAALEDLEHASDKDDWWMEFVAENKDLSSVGKGLYQDDLIRVGNAATDLGFPGLVHACAYTLAEMTENMKLAELRTFLHEEYDFPDDIKKKISACPEFAEL